MNKHSYKVGDRVVLTKEMELVIGIRFERHPEHDGLILKGPHIVRSITCEYGCKIISTDDCVHTKFVHWHPKESWNQYHTAFELYKSKGPYLANNGEEINV